MSKQQYIEYITPFGELVYPNFQEPRQFEGKGDYHYDGMLQLEPGSDMIDVPDGSGGHMPTPFPEFIDQLLEMARATFNTKDPFHTPVQEADENGLYRVKFKVAAETKTKSGRMWDRRPNIFDAGGAIVESCPPLGTGTVARIAFQVYPWNKQRKVGITLQPTKIQIREFVERPAASMGAVEGGGWQAEDQGEFASSGAGGGGDF